ncbi:MAG: hypothetical protein LAN71_07990 [Acidobacteriia bacterium]|nr:hypothetical protein [Terriglobia bacterium]
MKTKACRNVFAGLVAVMLFSGATALHAEQTHRWRQSSHDEFLKGTANGIAVRSDGRLEAAPRFLLLADTDSSYLWSLRLDGQGAVYAAGGSPAKVFRLDSGSNKPVKVFESSELSAQALAFDGKGGFFVGTSPDGKVYHVTAQGQKTVFFDPGAKYIWDLALGADGTLYVATGDKGLLFAVSPEGKSERFYSSDEAHIRVLAFDGRGNLLAGTEPNGRILRFALAPVKPGQEHSAFVLLETSKHEVTALATAGDGSVFAAVIGEKQRPGAVAAPGAAQAFIFSTGPAGSAAGGAAPAMPAPGAGQLSPQIKPLLSPAPAPLSSAIYRIAPDGAPEELWSSREEAVYSLGLDISGRVLAGTGNGGALLAIDGRKISAQLAKSGAAQVTGIARGTDGKVYLCTANPGKIFSAGPELETEGSYESRSFDAQIFSQWGRLEWWSTISPDSNGKSANTRLSFFVRSGNTEDPGREWSPWAGPYTRPGETVHAPAARFVQWKAVLRNAKAGEEIDWVSLAYLPRNVAPVLDAIVVQEPGVRVQGPFGSVGGAGQAMVTLKLPAQKGASGVFGAPGLPGLTAGITPQKIDAAPQGMAQKGYRSVLWAAHDDNEDELRYAVYYRGEAEHDWKLLKDGIEQNFFSWDATALPDGAYYLKITATDAPSNPPAAALTAERESERFEVDNTPPVVEGLRAAQSTKKGGGIDAQCVVRDAASGIERAQYSLDGGEWTLLAPLGELSDAAEERYEWSFFGLAPGEHTLAVRAYDRQENIGSAKIVFTVLVAKR